MADVWKRGTGLGDERLDDRAALMMAQAVATHSLVLNRMGGGRAGAVGAGRLLASEKATPDGLLAAEFARTPAATGVAAASGLRATASRRASSLIR